MLSIAQRINNKLSLLYLNIPTVNRYKKSETYNYKKWGLIAREDSCVAEKMVDEW